MPRPAQRRRASRRRARFAVNLYAESSAVLAWLLDEKSAADVRQSLALAEIIVASDLTLIECDRVLLRAAALGELTEAEAADRRAHLTAAASHWQILRVAPEIVERARQRFPGEPIRTLDAIHLASVLAARTAIVGLKLLSLDDRVRKAGKKLGLDIIPM
jgi:predicted nucleic acid-binding protein